MLYTEQEKSGYTIDIRSPEMSRLCLTQTNEHHDLTQALFPTLQNKLTYTKTRFLNRQGKAILICTGLVLPEKHTGENETERESIDDAWSILSPVQHDGLESMNDAGYSTVAKRKITELKETW
jgi:hypothetical protein